MSDDNTRRYVVTYDIQEDRRRTRIAKVLQTYGDRIQYSVFIVDARPGKLVRLRDSLHGLVDVNGDSVYIFDLGQHNSLNWGKQMFVLGRGPKITSNDIIIV